MVSIKEVDAGELVDRLAQELKKLSEISPPGWSRFAKTGVHRERPPSQKDWWYTRSASLLRKVYLEGQGVSKLRKAYGGRKNRGHKPEHKKLASGAVIRKILQQLETVGLVKTEKLRGRLITPKGQVMLNKIAKQMRGKPQKPPEKPKEKKPEPKAKKQTGDLNERI